MNTSNYPLNNHEWLFSKWIDNLHHFDLSKFFQKTLTQKEFCQNINNQWKQRYLLMKSVCLHLFLSVWLRRSIFWQKLAIFRQNGFLLTSFYHFLAWFKKKYQLMEIVSADKSNPKISSGNVMWLLRNTLNTKSYSYFDFLHHFRCFFLRFTWFLEVTDFELFFSLFNVIFFM